MFSEGNILYFDPFYFKNGNTAKKKYFIVLKNVDNKTILASLPSSKDFVPTEWQKENKCHCIEIPQANFNCFFLLANIIITTNGWSFPENTYLYGHQIDEYEVNNLKDIYPIEGIDFEIVGVINSNIYEAIINCLRTSSSVKRKFKKIL